MRGGWLQGGSAAPVFTAVTHLQGRWLNSSRRQFFGTRSLARLRRRWSAMFLNWRSMSLVARFAGGVTPSMTIWGAPTAATSPTGVRLLATNSITADADDAAGRPMQRPRVRSSCSAMPSPIGRVSVAQFARRRVSSSNASSGAPRRGPLADERSTPRPMSSRSAAARVFFKLRSTDDFVYALRHEVIRNSECTVHGRPRTQREGPCRWMAHDEQNGAEYRHASCEPPRPWVSCPHGRQGGE
jgi:hypothetical protein